MGVSLSKGTPDEPPRSMPSVSPPPMPAHVVQPVTPAGWYPEPGGSASLRYWDGTAWTNHLAPAAPAHHAPQVVMVSDQRVSGAVIVVAWIVAVLSAGYMLPWAIAATRGKANGGAVFVVNLFLGWTLIGWVVALVMACGSHGFRPAYR